MKIYGLGVLISFGLAGVSVVTAQTAQPVDVLKADKHFRVEVAEKSANGSVEREDLEAMYDRIVAAAQKDLPPGGDFVARETFCQGIRGDLNEYPPTFVAAALVADPEGGQVYLVGRILEAWQIGFGPLDTVAMAEILFAKLNPKGAAAYSRYVGLKTVPAPRNRQTEKDLATLLTLMGLDDPTVLEEGKPLLDGDISKLRAWLLEQSNYAAFSGHDEAKQDFEDFLRQAK